MFPENEYLIFLDNPELQEDKPVRFDVFPVDQQAGGNRK